MFEFDVQLFLSFKDKLTIESYEYQFDYSSENITLFEKNYGFTNIKFDENFKATYPKFFVVEKCGRIKDEPEYLHFKFKFGKFCNFYKITSENFLDMYKKGNNYFPFPLIGKAIIKDGNEKIECNFKSKIMSGTMFILLYPGNDIYFLKYINQDLCEFTLFKNLTEKEKIEYDNYMAQYEVFGFSVPP